MVDTQISIVKILSGGKGYYEKFGAIMVDYDEELLNNYRSTTIKEILYECCESNFDIIKYDDKNFTDIVDKVNLNLTISELAELSLKKCGLLDLVFGFLLKYHTTTLDINAMIINQYKEFTYDDIDRLDLVFDL